MKKTMMVLMLIPLMAMPLHAYRVEPGELEEAEMKAMVPEDFTVVMVTDDGLGLVIEAEDGIQFDFTIHPGVGAFITLRKDVTLREDASYLRICRVLNDINGYISGPRACIRDDCISFVYNTVLPPSGFDTEMIRSILSKAIDAMYAGFTIVIDEDIAM